MKLESKEAKMQHIEAKILDLIKKSIVNGIVVESVGLSWEGLQVFSDEPELLVSGEEYLTIHDVRIVFEPSQKEAVDISINPKSPLSAELKSSRSRYAALLTLDSIRTIVANTATGYYPDVLESLAAIQAKIEVYREWYPDEKSN